MDQAKVLLAATLFPDQKPAKFDLLLSILVSCTVKPGEAPPPAFEPLQPLSRDPIDFGNEGEEEIRRFMWIWIQIRKTREVLYSLRPRTCMHNLLDYIYYSPLNCNRRLALNASKGSNLSLV